MKCGNLNITHSPIENKHWKSVHPFLDENQSNDKGTPTMLARGLFNYYSMPIWATPANQYEELLFRMRVPHRWDGTTNPYFVAITSPVAAETADDRYQFQIEWQSEDVGAVMPDTTQETLTIEIILVSGENAAFFAHIIAFELTSTTLASGQNLQFRLRRIAATADEISNEVAVYHWDSRWLMERVGTTSIQGY